MAPITQGPYSETQRMELRALIRLSSEIIAYYWPMRTFVHHNPLHGLEVHPFDEALGQAQRLLGGKGYLANEIFREYARSEPNSSTPPGPRPETPRARPIGETGRAHGHPIGSAACLFPSQNRSAGRRDARPSDPASSRPSCHRGARRALGFEFGAGHTKKSARRHRSGSARLSRQYGAIKILALGSPTKSIGNRSNGAKRF